MRHTPRVAAPGSNKFDYAQTIHRSSTDTVGKLCVTAAAMLMERG